MNPSAAAKASMILMNAICASLSFASSTGTCDFYDEYGMYFLSFDKSIKLGRSGPSNVSGISFLFKDGSTLRIMPSVETYSQPGETLSGDVKFMDDIDIPDDIRFVIEHLKDGCEASKIKEPNGIKVTCEGSEYAIFDIDNQPAKKYLYVYYNFSGGESRNQYEKIVRSLRIMPPGFYEPFHEIVNDAAGAYYFSQDEAYRNRVDEYEQPAYIACGKYRARDKLIRLVRKKAK